MDGAYCVDKPDVHLLVLRVLQCSDAEVEGVHFLILCCNHITELSLCRHSTATNGRSTASAVR